MYGAFHGATARIAPYGSLKTRAERPAVLVVGIEPLREVMRPATSRSISAARERLKEAQAEVAPVSSIMMVESSGEREDRI